MVSFEAFIEENGNYEEPKLTVVHKSSRPVCNFNSLKSFF